MDTLLHIGLTNAMVAAVLALGVIVAALACRRPALLHGLWLLVLLKLLTPPLVTIPVSWLSRTSPAAKPAPPAADVSLVNEAPTPADAEAPVAAPIEAAAPALAEPAIPAPLTAPPASRWSWQKPVLIVWLAGTAAWFTLAVIRLCRFQRQLRHAWPAPGGVCEKVYHLSREMGLRRIPGVWLVPGRLPPLLWALGEPRLVLAAELLRRLSPAQLETLLIHELAHLKRHDHWVRLVEFLVRGLYWWHPVVWYACRELREAEEQCCDAWVVTTRPAAGRAYATALVNTLDFLSQTRSAAPLLASGIGPVSDLKRRLSMIMRGLTPRELGWQAGLAVLILGLALLPLLPTWADEEPGQPPRPQAPPGNDGQPFPRPKNDDADRLRAELHKLQEEMQKRQHEMQEIQRRMQEIAGRMQLEGGRENPPRNPGDPRQAIILRLAPVQGDGPREIVLRQVDGKWTVVGAKDGRAEIIMQAVPGPGGPNPFGRPHEGRQGPPGGPGPQPGGEDRLQHLERKLQELEQLIRAIRQPMPPGSPSPRPGRQGDQRE